MLEQKQLERLGLFDARVPRYTSYPTAPHFNGAVTPDVHRQWIRDVQPGSAISLYLHIPFCRQLCWFCACRTQGTSTLAPVESYLQTVLNELQTVADLLPSGVTLSRLHFGGGTPTLMEPSQIERLVGAIADRFAFAESYEFSVEIDPNEIDGHRVAALAKGGMNRASIGVQDFDQRIQDAIGRQQSYELTARAVTLLRESGIYSLNADILFGLPYQTKPRMVESVQKLLTLEPDRVALYGYAHVPWMARRQTLIASDALPTPHERLALFEAAKKLFLWDGYQEIGIDHFAKPDDGLAVAQKAGRLRRNFQGYTDDTSEVLIGLGASAISKFPQGYAQNASATSAYAAAVREGALPTHRGHVFSEDDKIRAALIERLMCDFELRLEDLPPEHLAVLRTVLPDIAMRFGEALDVGDKVVSIPERARPLTRIVARAFDAYEMDENGHSPAF